MHSSRVFIPALVLAAGMLAGGSPAAAAAPAAPQLGPSPADDVIRFHDVEETEPAPPTAEERALERLAATAAGCAGGALLGALCGASSMLLCAYNFASASYLSGLLLAVSLAPPATLCGAGAGGQAGVLLSSFIYDAGRDTAGARVFTLVAGVVGTLATLVVGYALFTGQPWGDDPMDIGLVGAFPPYLTVIGVSAALALQPLLTLSVYNLATSFGTEE